MTAIPDPRWQYFVGNVSKDGVVQVMSFEHLKSMSDEWSQLIPKGLEMEGPLAILRTSRSLFAHSWFDYEFMVVAALVSFQALESAFHRLYPDVDESYPFKKLVNRARRDGTLESRFADLANSAVELRNLLSHPRGAAAFTVGMAAPMLENTHRLVVLILETARIKSRS
jgi:hypothetical protein